MKRKILILLFLVGCSTERITEPIQDGISGVYQSVEYQEKITTFTVKLEIYQRGFDVTGTLKIDEANYSVRGSLKDGHLLLESDGGLLDVWIDQRGNYYPLAGALTWMGEMRAIRFQLISLLHNQGGML